MTKVAKIAVSLPETTMRALERERKRQGRSRSALVAEAIEGWLATQRVGAVDEAYVRGYLEQPEARSPLVAVAREAIEEWESWE
jgi:metal-responsive CopG/Arc/MetJ family transcriptional regulator